MRLVKISLVIWIFVFALVALSSKNAEAREGRGGLSRLFGDNFMDTAFRFYDSGQRHRENMESYRADNIRATTEAYDTVSNAADRRDATHYMIRSGKMNYYGNGTAAVGVNFGTDYNGGGNYQPSGSGNRGGGRRGGSGGWWSNGRWVSMP